jgi:signal transduction histidine kinase
MISYILVAIIIFLSLGLGGVVYFKNPKGRINQIFAALVVFVVIWLVSNYLENEPINPKLASLFLKIDFASAAVLAYFFFLFAVNFQGTYLIRSGFKQLLAFLPTLIFSFLSFSNLIITKINFQDHTIFFEEGVLYPLYAFSIISYIGTGCADLVLKYRKLTGTEKLQTFYVLLGLSLSATIALIVNLFFQQVLPVSIFRLGNYGIFFFIGFTTFAILRHHLLEIKVILTETLVALIALLLLVQAFFFKTAYEFAFKFALFALFIYFGYLLIKSVLQEIDRRKELEDMTNRLKKAYRELEKLDEAKSEFVSIASHQLRTPLTAIKGYISMMLEKIYGNPPQKMKKPLENIYASNERLIRLVNDLLNVSRIEAGKIKLEQEKVRIDDMISSIIEELKNTLKERKVHLKFEKPRKALPKILVDKSKLRQIIMNVIDNAIRYTHKGEITVKVENTTSKIRIIISDTGEGMTKEEISHLFESFSRGKAGTRFWTEGAGLGLYVAKKFVDMHNGKIWAESPGKEKGSTFYIELPTK